ncbi:hypothetical protein ARALYDRAFT_481487 [Arabidopsis lyrata subsp. lyrata]|uniref:Smr domain-containing protein n=1 Tax=Arabidopsis lyrata subsp. lyrata TaxID=81972 RepID=D7LCV9_ARALL|nr:hypothetical protein ARALYDRAFT_481487 [Arabidopsis lyrata subsp. lyrata]
MSLTKKASDPKISGTSIKPTTLNPHAAEFVPFTLRSPSSGGTSTLDAATSRLLASSSSVGKAVLDRTESSASHHSDEEARQFWSHQLPDDITPDFGLMTQDDNSYGSGSLSLASLSLFDGNEAEKFPSASGGFGFSDQTGLASHNASGNSLGEKSIYPISSFVEDPQRPSFMHLSPKPWDKQIMNAEQLLGNDRERNPFSGKSRHGFVNELITESAGEMEVNPVDFLASQFPGFATESLAEVYFANGCDLQLTVEMLTQLELQVDGGLNQNISPKSYAPPSLTPMDFPALSISNSHGIPAQFGGDDLQQTGNHYQSPEKDNMFFFKSGPSVTQPGSIDYVSAVRKLASPDSGMWKYERNDSADSSIGSSRNSGAYKSGRGRSIYSDKLQSRAQTRPAPVWVETGDAVGNMYSELREEARDYARLRNVYFEQARQAYLVGNKALAKELSVKGQLHNMQMKAAHGKAQEAIYRQRNPVGQGNSRGNERMIDLHGLHVSEALQVLKHELSVLRSTARATQERLQVFICVGTGHHTRGSRTPARLPVAVQRYLLEEEGLDYSEPQAGLLRVIIY